MHEAINKVVSFHMILNVTYCFELQKYNVTAEIETSDKKLWFEILGVVQDSNRKKLECLPRYITLQYPGVVNICMAP